MYVFVQHRISDPQGFASRSGDVLAPPEGLRAIQFFSDPDTTAAVCLWEADSVDAVRNHLEPLIASSSDNSYHQVNEQYALGLPERTRAE